MSRLLSNRRWGLPFSALMLSSRSAGGFVPRLTLPSATSKTENLKSAGSLIARSMSSEYGIGMDQAAMMESDQLVAVDRNDVLINGATISKRKAHEFNKESPRGIAHRAFSVFLFNEENEMLLTRRADSKITFPGVWTNACCSHPLFGMKPEEVDEVPAAFPDFPGIKYAAIRKLKHELGIDPKFVPHEDFQFVKRFHYWAADTLTYGPDTPWGEHEIDYVLFLRCAEQPKVNPNSEEVSDFKYVSIEALKSMMEEPDLKWSPWFLGIMERGCFDWWADLDGALEGKYVDPEVTYFACSEEHSASYNLPSHSEDVGVLSNEKEPSF